MTFDYFLDTGKLVWKYAELKMRDGMKEYAVKRREAIKEKKDNDFQKLIMASANWEQQVNSVIASTLY